MPAQMPRFTVPSGLVISEPDSLAMIMSMPGAMPSSSVPTISPVMSSGSVPRLTVRPVTGWPSSRLSIGNGSGQSAVAAGSAADPVAAMGITAAANVLVDTTTSAARTQRDRKDRDG
ncbi:MAG: hypothetical protein GEV04_04450 [Actinophytocola sp.]|nr:hypothetical protein [Actinophytocola sp.]